MPALTSDIAKFVASISASAVPERCNFGARIGMLDCVGTMIAGADEEAVRLVAQIVPTYTGNDGAPEIPGGRNLSAGDAALVNGVAAHVLDYDDVGMDGHPSAALTPAILAEGWTLGSSGEEAVAAYVAGYEVWALLQELESGALHERGFHPTAIWGTLSAAAAVGETWRLEKMGINIKRNPMCYATHRSINVMRDLAAEHNLDPKSVDEIHVRIGTAQDLMLRNREPKTALEAKFSIEFAMASALIARKVGLKELDDGFVRRDDIIETMRKVKRSTTEERMADMPPFAPDDRVSIRLKSGEEIRHEPVVRPKGHWQKPLTETELREKFLDCTEARLGRQEAEALFEKLNNLEDVASLRELPVVKL